MIIDMKNVDHQDNRAMVYILSRTDIPKSIKMPKREWAIKTVGCNRGIKFKRSDRKVIVADISTPKKLQLVLRHLRKIMCPSGFTSVAIVKQGRMKYSTYLKIVKEELFDSIINIEVYDSVP